MYNLMRKRDKDEKDIDVWLIYDFFFFPLMNRHYLNAADQLQVAQVSYSNKGLKMEKQCD